MEKSEEREVRDTLALAALRSGLYPYKGSRPVLFTNADLAAWCFNVAEAWMRESEERDNEE